MTNPNDPIHAMPEMAFPSELQGKVLQLHSQYGGLTKREWLLGMVVNGVLSNRQMLPDASYIPTYALDLVDKLIAELNKEPS